ncbi:MAG: T9SS type B sorting domain-containing protein [Saprospiraceae bacterium]|nr:T9SS type B sorting domain-containing protein [Saprospiraceae bacterium]
MQITKTVNVTTITAGGLQNYTYLWCNQVTTPNQNNLQLGAYTLTITDALGCNITDTLFVNVFPDIMLTPNCDGTADASISSEACIEYAIAWDNGQTGKRATGLTNGNHTVTATAPNGTIISSDFVIDIPEIQVTTNVTNTTCPDFLDGTATVTADNGVAPYTYRWSNDSTTATIRNLAPGDYVVTVTDSRNCSIERSITIAPASPISVTIPEPQSCEGEPVVLSVINNKPEDILTYRWTPSNLFLVGTDTTATPTYISSAAGSVEVTITNQFGCTTQQSVDIAFEERLRPEPSDLTYEESCLGLLVRFNGNGQTGGYIWRFGDPNLSNDISSELNPIFTYSQPGTYKVTLIPANSTFCRDTTQFDVVVKGALPLNVEVQGDTLVCNDETTSLNVNDSRFSSVRWFSTNNELLSENTNFTAAAGTYRVVAQNAEGCSGERLVTVVNQGVNINLEDTYALCRGESLPIEVINLNANDLLNFQWTSGNPNGIDDPTSDMPTFRVNETTIFTATVTNQYGCSFTKQVTIEVKELPEIDGILASPDTINSGETSNISITGAKGNYAYAWDSDPTLSNTNAPSTIASPSQTNIYLVEITNEDGCSIKPEVRVVVFDLPCEMPYLYLPNAFTPNNDGVNDVLFVRGFHIERMNLIIYNRWGEKVFETQNQKEGWDGTYKGEPATGDVFGYYLEVDCIGNESNVFKGNITILR